MAATCGDTPEPCLTTREERSARLCSASVPLVDCRIVSGCPRPAPRLARGRQRGGWGLTYLPPLLRAPPAPGAYLLTPNVCCGTDLRNVKKYETLMISRRAPAPSANLGAEPPRPPRAQPSTLAGGPSCKAATISSSCGPTLRALPPSEPWRTPLPAKREGQS